MSNGPICRTFVTERPEAPGDVTPGRAELAQHACESNLIRIASPGVLLSQLRYLPLYSHLEYPEAARNGYCCAILSVR